MNIINTDEWSESISKYINSYMYDIKLMQHFRKTGEYKEYLKQKVKCDEKKSNIINCINMIEVYNLLPHK